MPAYLLNGLSKVLKITNICAHDSLGDCGVPSTITALNGDVISVVPTDLFAFNSLFNNSTYYHAQLNTKAAAFETQNGESILAFYNPNCTSNMGETANHSVQPKICANFIFDLNGNKGPNTVGKDIGFMTVLYATDPLFLAPNPIAADTGTNTYRTQAAKKCRDLGADYRLPNADELTSMYYNRKFLNIKNNYYWSSITSGPDANWALEMGNGTLVNFAHPNTALIRCLKR